MLLAQFVKQNCFVVPIFFNSNVICNTNKLSAVSFLGYSFSIYDSLLAKNIFPPPRLNTV